MGSTVRTRLLGVITVEPLAEAAVTECMTTLGRVGFVHRAYAYPTCYEVPQVVDIALENVGEGLLAQASVDCHGAERLSRPLLE